MSLFITFEGVEGCGKSYQSKVLYNRLILNDVPAIWTYEPGGTPLGNKVRFLLKRKQQYKISAETELFLFSACRAQLVEDVIQPALKKEQTVICDRFTGSTLAYQGYGRGLDLSIINFTNGISTQNIKPDLIVLLDLPVEQGLSRKKSGDNDRFETETVTFHERVRKGYLKQADEDGEHWLVIDARLSRKEISATIWNRVVILLDRIP